MQYSILTEGKKKPNNFLIRLFSEFGKEEWAEILLEAKQKEHQMRT